MKITGALFAQGGGKAGGDASGLGAIFGSDEFLGCQRLRFGFDGFGGFHRRFRFSLGDPRGGFHQFRQRHGAASLVIQVRGQVRFEDGSLFDASQFQRRCLTAP
jgi:hypothetical protein